MILASATIFFFLGLAMSSRLWTRKADAPLRIERAAFAALTGCILWVGTSWILMLTGTFTRPVLLARMLVAVIAAVILGRVRLVDAEEEIEVLPDRGLRVLSVVAVAPVVAFIVFTMWRTNALPPVSHDALAYHLPKAAFIVRDGGYRHVAQLHESVRTLPINYELLLAEAIVLDKSDARTEWVSVLAYGLFILFALALTYRWWRPSVPVMLLMLPCIASTPVALLHAGAHKNDLLVTAFLIGGLMACGRWLSLRTDVASLVLAIAAFGLATATKPTAALVAIAIAPFLLIALIRSPVERSRAAKTALVAAVLAFLLLGGALFLINFTHEDSLLSARATPGEPRSGAGYGDWRSLWEGPYVLLAAPFSRSDTSISVPWSQRPWFWRRYELYFSSLGLLFPFAVLSLPFAIMAARRRSDGRSFERMALSLAALLAFLLLLPIRFVPHGMYQISLPRYALFIVPIVFAWCVPLLERLRGGVIAAAIFVAAAWFSVQAVLAVQNDAFVPLKYVAFVTEHPGTRVVPFDPNRAASIADRMAGPHDTIAVESAYGTWIYPAFGSGLTRNVRILPDRNAQVPADAKWVVIDRAYNIVWGHPSFRDLGDTRYLTHGKASAADVALLDTMRADSRFELVFYNPRMNQAVFHRR